MLAEPYEIASIANQIVVVFKYSRFTVAACVAETVFVEAVFYIGVAVYIHIATGY